MRYTTAERLADIIRIHEDNGVIVFNAHTHVLEDGGMKETDLGQLGFEHEADPRGLMNPGRMRGWDEAAGP